jgi:hypothetical protein
LGEAGRAVRCVTCHTLWFEQPNQVAETVGFAARDASDPAQIRPPLDDVVEIGDAQSGYLQPAGGHGDTEFGAEPAHGIAPHDVAPSIVRSADDAGPIQKRFDAPTNVERAAASRPGKKAPRRGLPLSRHALPAAICALALVLVCLVATRQQVVRFLPQTASLYARIGLPVNLRGLAFENVKTSRELADGVPMLIVEGDIVGTTGRHTEVPRLRFAVTDSTGKEIYAWTARPSRTLLTPGETMPFRSRLASPPAEASGVSVRFFNRRDAQAGFM